MPISDITKPIRLELYLNALKDIFKHKGYHFATGRDADNRPILYDLNIIGLRNFKGVPNKFDDVLILIFRNIRGNMEFRFYPFTTDPGESWIKKPMNGNGTAVVMEGQYKEAYTFGIHKGYRALTQTGVPLNIRRIPKGGDLLLFNTYPIGTSTRSINIHRASTNRPSVDVNLWSAGCQVFSNSTHFQEFLGLFELQIQHTGKTKFTYTLLNSSDSPFFDEIMAAAGSTMPITFK
jgi:hypothetical protein